MKPCFVQAFDTGGDERYSAIRIDHNSRSDIPRRYTITEDGGLTVIEKVKPTLIGNTVLFFFHNIQMKIVFKRKNAPFPYPNSGNFWITHVIYMNSVRIKKRPLPISRSERQMPYTDHAAPIEETAPEILKADILTNDKGDAVSTSFQMNQAKNLEKLVGREGLFPNLCGILARDANLDCRDLMAAKIVNVTVSNPPHRCKSNCKQSDPRQSAPPFLPRKVAEKENSGNCRNKN